MYCICSESVKFPETSTWLPRQTHQSCFCGASHCIQLDVEEKRRGGKKQANPCLFLKISLKVSDISSTSSGSVYVYGKSLMHFVKVLSQKPPVIFSAGEFGAVLSHLKSEHYHADGQRVHQHAVLSQRTGWRRDLGNLCHVCCSIHFNIPFCCFSTD